MSKIYLDLKYTAAVGQAYRCDAESLMLATGRNLGNLPFRYALTGLMEGVEQYQRLTFAELEALMKANNGCRGDETVHETSVNKTIISAANWLTDASSGIPSNLGKISEILEWLDSDIVIFGLGAQAALGTEKMRLSKEAQRFVHLLSERSAKISVRDVFTQAVLSDHGVDNVVVTGCPSNFINKDPNLGKSIIEKAESLSREVSSWAELRVAISEVQYNRDQTEAILWDLVKKLEDTPCFYILQEKTLLSMLLQESNVTGTKTGLRKVKHKLLGLIRKPYWQSGRIGVPSRMNINHARQVLRSKTLHFSGVEAWLDFARTCDFAFGMRIHGTMIPLQAGVPAVLIAHDARTQGLAETMKIPNLTPAEYLTKFKDDPCEFLRYCANSLEPYDSNRSDLSEVMANFLNSNGLQPMAELEALKKT